MARLTIRLDFDSGASIGPGKVGLLEAVEETGSIRKAAARMKMSFRQAWLLILAVETMFEAPVVQTLRGGKGGGGAKLTELGHWVVSHYREMERLAGEAAQQEVSALNARAKGPHEDCVSPGRKAKLSRRSLKKKA